MIIVLLV